MPRKLKVYVTSIGFFDLAIAVPSMKAALKVWGADSNLFHQNFAKEVHDADIVKSAMAHPGIVLKRPVGSTKPFAETSELPEDLVSTKKRSTPPRKLRSNESENGKSVVDAKKASAAYEREERKRRALERREEATRETAFRKRAAAFAKAEARLHAAQTEHDGKAAKLAASRAELDRDERGETMRWETEKRKLEAAVKKAKTT
jgi:hypothetical protein